MITQETFARIRRHAGVDQWANPDEREQGKLPPTVSETTYPHGLVTDALQLAMLDFLSAMHVLNHEINGPVPSDLIAKPVDDLPRQLVWAICQIISMLRESAREAQDETARAWLERAAWRAETAWTFVLDGDMDDLIEDLAGEEAGYFNEQL